jgi:hypothetical protein
LVVDGGVWPGEKDKEAGDETYCVDMPLAQGMTGSAVAKNYPVVNPISGNILDESTLLK